MVETVLKIVKGGDVRSVTPTEKLTAENAKKEAPDDFTLINVDKFTAKDVLWIKAEHRFPIVQWHIKQKEIQANKEDVKPDWDDYAKQGFLL